MKKIRVQYFASAIGCPQTQKDTVRCLGFTRLGQVRECVDSVPVRGMIRKISHLVRVVEGK